jgi:hypothetical protein
MKLSMLPQINVICSCLSFSWQSTLVSILIQVHMSAGNSTGGGDDHQSAHDCGDSKSMLTFLAPITELVLLCVIIA